MGAFGFGARLGLGGTAVASRPAFDFTAGSLPAGATFARGSVATSFDGSGALVSAAAGTPRFDHDPTSHALRGLLIEPQQTNLLQQSEALSVTTSWAPTRMSVNPDSGGAPTGAMTADLLQTAAVPTSYIRQTTPGLSIGQSYTLSIFARAATANLLTLLHTATSPATTATFDLNAGSVTSGTGTIAPVGNGFYRCSLAFVATAVSGVIQIEIDSSGPVLGISAWGAQFEAGGLSSYIPTATTTATRAADVLTLDWASRGVADGPHVWRYTFDDLTTQDVAATLSGGTMIVPVSLARRRLRRVALA